MPRTGRNTLIRLLWTMFGACLIGAGCTADRDLPLSETEPLAWHSVPQNATPDGVVSATAAADSQTEAGVMPAALVAVGEDPPASQQVAVPDGPLAATRAGVVANGPCAVDTANAMVPRELEKVTHPTYVIQPPDVLLIDAARLVPRPPYRVEPLDTLAIWVTGTLPNADIKGLYQVDASGNVNLGFTYGSVVLFGQTLEEAKQTITKHMKEKLKPPFEVYVSLAESKLMQQVRGEHLVRQDGTIGLGTYGSVWVTGMTIAQAKAAIEKHLEQFLFKPQVSVDVAGFNSHVYYVIYDFPGTGQMIYRMPITGNETVLDALGTLRFLPQGVSKRRIWVSRPGPAKCGRTQIMPVDWQAITRNGATATNYQLLPGDRIYVAPDPCSNLDAQLARIFAPVERVLGIVLLGNSTVQAFNPAFFGGGFGGGGGVR